MENFSINKKFQKVPVNFGDFIIALSEVSGVPIEKMNLEVISEDAFFEGDLSLDEVARKVNPKTNSYSINILFKYGDKNSAVYSFKHPLDLKKIQADGKTLKEHCSVDHFMMPDYNPNEVVPATYIKFDKEPEGLILEIPKDMTNRKDLLSMAVKKCGLLNQNQREMN